MRMPFQLKPAPSSKTPTTAARRPFRRIRSRGFRTLVGIQGRTLLVHRHEFVGVSEIGTGETVDDERIQSPQFPRRGPGGLIGIEDAAGTDAKGAVETVQRRRHDLDVHDAAARARAEQPRVCRQAPRPDADEQRSRVIDPADGAALGQAVAGEVAGTAQVEIFRRGHDQIKIQVVEEHGGGPGEAAKQSEFHEDERDGERDAAGGDCGPRLFMGQVRPGKQKWGHGNPGDRSSIVTSYRQGIPVASAFTYRPPKQPNSGSRKQAARYDHKPDQPRQDDGCADK